MVDAFYADNNRIQVLNNNDISFDTDRPSIELFTDAAITLSNQEIEFPSYVTTWAYYLSAAGNITACQTWAIMPWQEWGPTEGYNDELYYPATGLWERTGPTTRNLPSRLLGSVPANTTYLDVRVRLTRTVNPQPWYSKSDPNGQLPPVTLFKQGEWINLPGGSCPCEVVGSTARQFDIVKSGNNVFLERRQSARNSNTPHETAPNGQAQAAVNSTGFGWNSAIWAWSDGSYLPRSKYYLSHQLDAKGPDADGTKKPNGTNPCGFRNVTPNTRSVYTGDILITPGRHRG